MPFDPAIPNNGAPHLSSREEVNPSALLVAPPPPRAGQRHHIQKERRARILSETRKLITEKGVEGVTLRDLAARAGVSVQTIYNLAGNRANVMHAAISEYIVASIRYNKPKNRYPNSFLYISEALWHDAVQNSDYNRAATLACDGGIQELFDLVRTRHLRYLKVMLIRNFQSKASHIGLDLNALSENIVTLAGAAALEWAKGTLSLQDLRYRLASAYGLPILPLLPKGEIVEVTAWLKSVRALSQQKAERLT